MKKLTLIVVFALWLGLNLMHAQEPIQISSHVASTIAAKIMELDAKERELLYHLVKAGIVMDKIFFHQVYHRNPEVWKELQAYKGDDKAFIEAKFLIHFGPFDRLQGDLPFFGSTKKPLGAGFYPQDMTAEEFNAYVAKHPDSKEQMESPYTVIVRTPEGLEPVAYPKYYAQYLQECVVHLQKASELAENPSLKKYLEQRAKDLLSNDYFQSDCDWLDIVQNRVELVIGPYEVYEDALFNYKAAYEAFIYINDPVETEKVQAFISYLKEMQSNLPVDKKYLAENLPTLSPLKVSNLVFSAGDAKAGVHTIAFALPNDEKVRELKGSKKIILQNVMEAKYLNILLPIAQTLITPEQIFQIRFKAFLYHVILHEMSHPLGTDYIAPQAEKILVRKALKETYSLIEEAKADAVALYNTLLMIEKGVISKELSQAVFVTQLASMFRSMRFGVEDAHGGANLVQLNFLQEKQGIVEKDGFYSVDFEKIVPSLKQLVQEILEIQGTGDYDRAKAFIAKYGVLSPNLKAKLQQLQAIPIDLQPIFGNVRDLGDLFQDPSLNRDRYLD